MLRAAYYAINRDRRSHVYAINRDSRSHVYATQGATYGFTLPGAAEIHHEFQDHAPAYQKMK